MKKSSKLLGLLLAAGMFITGCDKTKPVVNPNDGDKTNEQGGKEQQHQHSFGEWKVTKSASCKEAGEKGAQAAAPGNADDLPGSHGVPE